MATLKTQADYQHESITPAIQAELDRKHDISYNPMSAAEFWWIHLSYEQREFISSRIKVSDNIQVPLYKIAYTDKRWADKEGWPIDSPINRR